MATLPGTIFRDAGKPDQALPCYKVCALSNTPIMGEERTGPSSISIPTTDGAACLAQELTWSEIWPARHNREVWKAGSDGTYAWRDQADGFFE
jgi:hypothetical protein